MRYNKIYSNEKYSMRMCRKVCPLQVHLLDVMEIA